MSAHSLFAAFLLSSLVLISFYLLERFLLSYIRSALCCSAPSRALASSLDFNHKERTYSSMGFGLCILLSAHLCHMLDLLFSLMYRFYISLNRTMISIRKSLSYHKLSFFFWRLWCCPTNIQLSVCVRTFLRQFMGRNTQLNEHMSEETLGFL